MDNTASKDPRYNLAYVMQETGIKADTLRAWERRYSLPQPQRTEGGHRLFSEFDIQVIRWLMEKEADGMRISKAVDLWHEIKKEGRTPLAESEQIGTAGNTPGKNSLPVESLEDLRERWVRAVLEYDEEEAEQLVNAAFARFSLETVCLDILQGGLSVIGRMWYEGKASVQQEHFASELVMRRLHAMTAAAPRSLFQKTILVGCPTGENHTFPSLLLTLLLRQRGWQVINLGANVPFTQLAETIEDTQPDLVVMTAMRLSSAAALHGPAMFLKERNIPLAFGGWIFEKIPGLAEKLPGNYLGGNMTEGISTIESLLQGSLTAVERNGKRRIHAAGTSPFLDYKDQIGKLALDAVMVKAGRGVNASNIREANDFLAEDILAGLALGDLSLVEFDLDWVGHLIGRQEFPRDILFDYLEVYLDAARKVLPDPNDPVIQWLSAIINHRTIEES